MKYFSKNQQLVICFIIALLFIVTCIKLGSYYPYCSLKGTTPKIILSSNNFYIHIAGEIQKPGVYCFSEKPSLFGIIIKAGGLKKELVLENRRDYGKIKNGTRITVKHKADNLAGVSLGMMETEKLIALNIPLDLNSLTKNDLKNIPGVGEGIAGRIVEYREHFGNFSKLEDLKKINGIGKKKYGIITKYLACPTGDSPS